jgi:transposase
MVYQKVHTDVGRWTGRKAAARRTATATGSATSEDSTHKAVAPLSGRTAHPERVDLRRRERRDWAETIGARAAHLLPADRELVEAVFVEGLGAEVAAERLGGSARTVRRRARAIAKRVLSREFEVVLREKDGWPRMRRLVATACVLQGRTLRDASAHLRVSLHVVRRQMDLVREIVEEGGLL